MLCVMVRSGAKGATITPVCATHLISLGEISLGCPNFSKDIFHSIYIDNKVALSPMDPERGVVLLARYVDNICIAVVDVPPHVYSHL